MYKIKFDFFIKFYDFQELVSVIEADRPTLVTGHFNLCFVKNSTNSISKELLKLGFEQMVTTATHIRGGHIDHAYWRDQSSSWCRPELEIYSPYYSDHDALLITLKPKDTEEGGSGE